LKTEPGEYSFTDLQRDRRTRWSGVKNPSALIHMRSMKKGDEVLLYHTGKERTVVGTATAASDPYPDPGAKNPGHVAIDLKPGKPLKRPVTLAEIRADARFSSLGLVRFTRLSVMPVSPEIWRAIVHISEKEG
jgi:predicted RNA-binding protein with PUA-like domain